MYFGNIITNSDITIDGFRVYSKDEPIDNDLPTLIIGWELTKEMYGYNVSILHKKINVKTFWTFTPKERKVDFENDLESFKEFCYNTFGDNIPYVYLDMLYGKKPINRRIIKKIVSLDNPYIYISSNDIAYIFGDNIIFGVDLNILTYFDGKRDKILNKIKSLKNCVLIDYKIFNNYRDLLYKIKNKNRLIPYIVRYGDVK